jgi:hypothetical protein
MTTRWGRSLRTTPALLGLFSLVALWAGQLAAERGPAAECVRGYPKPLPTFSEALALIRRELWTAQNVWADLIDRLLFIVCRPP